MFSRYEHMQLKEYVLVASYLVAILTSFLSGAAVAAVIPIPTPSIPPPLIQPLPIKIALCVTPALRAAQLRQSKHWARLEAGDGAPGQGPNWQLGEATVATLTTVMRAAFAEVVVIDSCNPTTGPPRNVRAMLVPEVTSVEVPLNVTAAAGNRLFSHARITLRMVLRSTQGSATVSWDVDGAEPIRFGLLGKLSEEDTTRVLSAGLLDACARFIADLYVNAEVHPWLTNLTANNPVQP
jgi:hypothetical protein